MDISVLILLGLFSLLILFALLGNLLVVAAIFYDRPLRRQPENLFLVSLAISDLLVSILVMVFAAANDLMGEWTFGPAYCQFWICFDITCSTASILNLCAISLDRYWHISRPMVYVRYCSRRRIYYCIVVVWFLSALIGAAPLAFGVGLKSENSMEHCEMDLPLPYAIGSSTLSFFAPAAVMVLLYTKLYLYARRHVRSIKTQLHQLRMSRWEKVSRHLPGARRASTHVTTETSPTQNHHQRTTVNDQKARLTLGVIMGTFLFCWVPFFILNILRSAVQWKVPKEIIMAVTWLGYANSALNPVIYSIFNRDFRRAFKKILFDLFVCCHGGDATMCKSANRLGVDCTAERRRSTRSSEAVENNNMCGGPATRMALMNNNEHSSSNNLGTPERHSQMM
ncbi:hypothetical protein PMAYCL1PPCAC_31063 [Pristionchus mayeri]|uniref:G-protein coupled receptors family 1 profile domain-containing protein n=1 Tax=Pristionchus mayeri TaxID=1317129 RepID=A0AAN5IC99_9BILA|nr:hypothetical protein PMAYCL1PPCAC_31063 [Pristionchus mayeri]